ncbi:uncharacterized protein LOC131326154 isoform X2 [Rhododendron vialii]|uniref:uncharacterized protein LOC131326154 isoform X2 n=1 Tax=Rhododendron vialii TaxID=182163 RepID=UPI00265F5C0E|nr:uncharacterized protein LOC131326154 isoform X2 [Rhododendron vialii]
MAMKTRRSSVGLQQEPISVRNFNTRFSLQTFVRRVEKLSDNQKTAIKGMGFGHLIQMPYQSLSRNLLAELMDRWDCQKRAFVFVPGEIAMTLMDVVLILGLRVTGKPVVLKESEPYIQLEREYGALIWNRKIPIASIEERLDSLGEAVNNDFIRSFLLFTFGTILFPNANGKVDSRYLSLLQDLDEVCHCAWGAAVLENIVDWLCKRRETNVQHMGGCLIFLQIVWKLLLTSEESKMDTIKELLEAQSDGEELAAQRFNVSIDKVNNGRTRLQIMGQWIAEMECESETNIAKELHGVEEDSSKITSPSKNEDILETSHNESKVQGVRMEHPWTISDSSSPIIISDEDDEDYLRAREQNMKLKREIDVLRKENQVLKNQLLSCSTLETENDKLRKEVGDLRREYQLANSLVSRLERLVLGEDGNATKEQSSPYNGNGETCNWK